MEHRGPRECRRRSTPETPDGSPASSSAARAGKRKRDGEAGERTGDVQGSVGRCDGSRSHTDRLPVRKPVSEYTSEDIRELEEILTSNLPSAGEEPSGYARLMSIPEGGSSRLKMQVYRGRTQKPDPMLLIDCTNLHNVIKRDKMPLVAVCLDGDEKGEWISCVLGFLHPRLILLQPVVMLDNTTIDHDSTRELEPIPPINLMDGDREKMKMVYLNACTKDMVGEDGMVKCSKDGPDMKRASDFCDLWKRSKKAGELPLYQFMVKSGPANSEGETVLAGSVSAENIDREFERKVRRKIAVERLGSRTDDGYSEFSYLESSNAKFLVRKNSVPREDFNPLLDELESFRRRVRIHEVPKDGRVALVESGGDVAEGDAVTYDENILPVERHGRTFAEFRESNDVRLDVEAIRFASARTFGRAGTYRSSTEECFGTCYFSAEKSRSATCAGPRMPCEEVRSFQLFNSSYDTTLLPWMNKFMDRAISLSAQERGRADPSYERIIKAAQKKANKDMVALASRMNDSIGSTFSLEHPGKLNSLGIWTTHNEASNFANGSHRDVSDSFGHYFMAYALDYLANYHRSALERNDSEQLGTVRYIIGMMGMMDPHRMQLSLATTCGYQTALKSGVGSSSFFHYDSICQAVAIPNNAVSYNTFRSFELMHHTGVCYSFDGDRVYLDARHLSLSAWGGSSSSDTSYTGRRTFAAGHLWAGQPVPARLTLRAYVERMIATGQVGAAQSTPGAWDTATAAEVARQGNAT